MILKLSLIFFPCLHGEHIRTHRPTRILLKNIKTFQSLGKHIPHLQTCECVHLYLQTSVIYFDLHIYRVI